MDPDDDLYTQAFRAADAGDIEGAMAGYRRILATQPREPVASASLAQLLLLKGDFARGWAMWEHRHQDKLTLRRWRGEPLKGQAIALIGEQGFGDIIQFVRFARPVAARGGRIVVACRNGLAGLLKTAPAVEAVIETGQTFPSGVTHWAPMLSLPYLLGLRPSDLPGPTPYLQADPGRVAHWRARIGSAPGLKVGLVWAGNRAVPYDGRRSPRFEPYKTLLGIPGVRFFSLQKGEGEQDLRGHALPPSFTDLGPELASFEDTAAAMTNLDLVISSCTAPAHLAGALGRPVWVVLARLPHWCWQLDRTDNDWYPTARLFRNRRAGEWTEVMAEVGAALQAVALGRAGLLDHTLRNAQ